MTKIEKKKGIVYVVDDDDSVRKSLSRLLRASGFSTTLFTSVEEFLSYSRPPEPSCLVLDVKMSGMDGLTLQRVLHTTPSDEIPILFITGHGDIPMSVTAMKDGAVDFLTKPFNDRQLLAAVDEALDRDSKKRASSKRIGELSNRFKILSRREREVLSLIISGYLNKQVGFELGITEKTVKVHRANIMKKTNVKSLAALVRLSIDAGIAPLATP